MDKDELLGLAKSGQFIPGIYNYCDRWCERCPVTARCLTFAMMKEQGGGQDVADLSNAEFWRHLTDSLRVAGELLRERAQELGVDLDSVTNEDRAEEEQRTEDAQNHECCLMAKRYADIVEAWFENGIADGEQSGQVGSGVSWKEGLEVIRWYQHQIYIKLLRAIRSDSEDQPEGFDDFPRDSVAQAKIALIGIDRSIAAWDVVRKRRCSRDDEVFDLMVHLGRLRRRVERVFPEARALVRPGFEAIDRLP